MPRTPKPPGHEDGVDAAQGPLGTGRGLALVAATQRMVTFASWWKPPARSASVTER